MESDAQGFVLYHGELADKHLGGDGIHQVAVGLGDRRRRLCESHRRLLERGSGRRKKLGGSCYVINQAPILLLRQTLPNTISLRKNKGMINITLQVVSCHAPSWTHDSVEYVVMGWFNLQLDTNGCSDV